jgi:hypothetical protein
LPTHGPESDGSHCSIGRSIRPSPQRGAIVEVVLLDDGTDVVDDVELEVDSVVGATVDDVVLVVVLPGAVVVVVGLGPVVVELLVVVIVVVLLLVVELEVEVVRLVVDVLVVDEVDVLVVDEVDVVVGSGQPGRIELSVTV